MADYVAFEEKEQIANLHLKLIASCQDFLIVRDVADATKHANLNPAKKIARQLSSSAQVDAPPGLFQVPFGEAYFREAIEVYVTLDSGEVKSLVPIIGSVLEMWRRRLSELSVGAFSGA
ncbi:MAG: hypothetical protein H0X47_00525 [Nitrospirales bacterium]|nr:hypothetical protein [Nitrospirales bacterium]